MIMRNELNQMKLGGLSKKLTRLIIILGLTTAAIISCIQVFNSYFSLKKNYTEQVYVSVNTISPAIEQSIWDLNFQQIELELTAIKNHPFVGTVELKMEHFDDLIVGDLANTGLIIEKPLLWSKNGHTELGILRVTLDEISLKNEFISVFISHIINNVLVIAITAFLLSFIFTKLITRRVYALVDKLHSVDVNDINAKLSIDHSVSVQNSDEIDQLKTAIQKLWDMRQISMQELIKSERRWRLALDSTSDGLWDWNLVTGDVFLSNNWKLMLGYDFDDVTQKIDEWQTLLHPDDREKVKADLEAHFNGVTETYTNSHRILCKNGQYKWVLDRGRVIERDNNKPIRMVGTHTDINALVEAQNQLKIAAMVYQQATEGMVVTNDNAEIIDVNNAFTTITGFTSEEVIGDKLNILSSGKYSDSFYRKMWESLLEQGYWQGELCNRNKAGEEYIEWLSISEIRNEKNQLQGYVGIFSDITERKQQEDIIYHQANYDALTSLVNRRFFLELLEKKIIASKRDKDIFWLMYLDLDHFKEVNDSLGHDFGDKLIQQWCHRVKEHLRESDIFSRLGGDEFAVIFCQVTEISMLDKLANNLIEILKQPFYIEGSEVFISASIGVAQYSKDGSNYSELIRAADQALYKAKQQGRSQHAYYTAELQQLLDEKVTLSNKLRKGIAAEEFQVCYQPITRLSDNKIIKAEALLRWKNEAGHFISPAIFIPVAEEIGLIDSLTEFVVNQVRETQLVWAEYYEAHVQVSVNLSPVSFKLMRKRKVDWYEKLKASHMPEKTIIFEITEGVLVDNDDTMMDLLAEFKDLGIEVALDDFGTGYSSLSYLHRFDIDFLKIDKQFIDDIHSNLDIKALCEAIIVMAHTLGLEVIAEGVETQLQADILKSLKCDYYQGYLSSPAINGADFAQRFLSSD